MMRVRTSSLGVRIEEVVASRLWSSRIGSVSIVVYLKPSDSRRLKMQETERKGLDMLDVIGDAKSKGETLSLVILNFFSPLFPTTLEKYIDDTV
jgi:hypothetical protein